MTAPLGILRIPPRALVRTPPSIDRAGIVPSWAVWVSPRALRISPRALRIPGVVVSWVARRLVVFVPSVIVVRVDVALVVVIVGV